MENKQLVTPGEVITEGMDYLPGDGTYRDGSNIRAALMGLAQTRDRLVKVIPLSGRYMPKKEDPVIGVVKEVRYSNWVLDINAPYDAVMMVGEAVDRFIDLKKDKLTNYFSVGDAVICRILHIDEGMSVMVTARGPGLRKLTDGQILDIAPSKIPRIIGKGASMVKMIKEYTGTRVFVGQNGRIWLQGGNEELTIRVIKKIEAEAHKAGLTDEIQKLLESEGNGNKA
ncbi:MAG: KH domain-containing protein [Candidatus Altiarchaeota archaeon]|nr:KH domain-containing protein [Candidatus Altiarchaeota archaeon]